MDHPVTCGNNNCYSYIQIYWIRIYYSFCNSGFFYLCSRNREWCWRKWNKVIETYSVLKKFSNGCCNNKNLQLIKKKTQCVFPIIILLANITNQSSKQTSWNLINIYPLQYDIFYLVYFLLYTMIFKSPQGIQLVCSEAVTLNWCLIK